MEPPVRTKVALRGSSNTVTEFLRYAINSILYQRGIYPPEDFTVVKKYDLGMLVTVNEKLKAYISKLAYQFESLYLSVFLTNCKNG